MKKLLSICLLAFSFATAAAQDNQMSVDDAILQKYFKEHKLKPMKTASGLYYTITQKGAGENAKGGQTVYVNYTGRTIKQEGEKTAEGEVFDSNIDPKFGHAQSFSFMLGAHNVITGWDEGIALLNKGAKATLYIPSPMAYGSNAVGDKIPANSIMMFDVELADIK
ncbi:MAG: FKBP-type peptidyl-prolyl cis-trans isomerase [Bacteroidetes bacterium]|nr:FKBP-type peptidyl-prolyl cis-trans isomerase [Bacteroidota bacterium]